MKDAYTFEYKEMIKQKMKNLISPRRTETVSFVGRFPSYEAAKQECEGYGAETIFNKVKIAALEVKAGNACYERDGYLFYQKDFYLQLVAVLLEIYLKERTLTIVDFGGSLGSTYYQNKEKLLPYINNFCWNIIEQKHFVEWGKENLEDSVLKFKYSLDEVDEYNCVLFGSSLQYLENYKGYLKEISRKKCKYVIIDRVTVSNEEWVSIEYVHEPIYEAAYPVMIFDEQKLIKFVEQLGYYLEMSWIKDTGETWQVGNKLMKEKSFFFVFHNV